MDDPVIELLQRTLRTKAHDIGAVDPAAHDDEVPVTPHAAAGRSPRLRRHARRYAWVGAAATVLLAVAAVAVFAARVHDHREGPDRAGWLPVPGWYVPSTPPAGTDLEKVSASIRAAGVWTVVRWASATTSGATTLRVIPSTAGAAEIPAIDRSVDSTVDVAGINVLIDRQPSGPSSGGNVPTPSTVALYWSLDDYTFSLQGPAVAEDDLLDVAKGIKPTDETGFARFAEGLSSRVRATPDLDHITFADGLHAAVHTDPSFGEADIHARPSAWVCLGVESGPCTFEHLSSSGYRDGGSELSGIASTFTVDGGVEIIGWVRGVDGTATARVIGGPDAGPLDVQVAPASLGVFFRVVVSPGQTIALELEGGGGSQSLIAQPAGQPTIR